MAQVTAAETDAKNIFNGNVFTVYVPFTTGNCSPTATRDEATGTKIV